MFCLSPGFVLAVMIDRQLCEWCLGLPTIRIVVLTRAIGAFFRGWLLHRSCSFPGWLSHRLICEWCLGLGGLAILFSTIRIGFETFLRWRRQSEMICGCIFIDILRRQLTFWFYVMDVIALHP
jgi:hypothetical protein